MRAARDWAVSTSWKPLDASLVVVVVASCCL